MLKIKGATNISVAPFVLPGLRLEGERRGERSVHDSRLGGEDTTGQLRGLAEVRRAQGSRGSSVINVVKYVEYLGTEGKGVLAA